MEYRNQGVFADRAVSIHIARLPLAAFKTLLLLIAVALVCRMAQADELHMIVNGKAIHLEHQSGTHYNESNWGAGLQYDFEKSKSNWVPFLTATGFADSNKNPSYYAGGGWLKRREFSLAGASWHADLGFVVFAMWRQEFNGGKPFLGALPAFSIGGERVAVNVTYIPKVDPKMVPILFFQLKLKLSNF